MFGIKVLDEEGGYAIEIKNVMSIHGERTNTGDCFQDERNKQARRIDKKQSTLRSLLQLSLACIPQ